MRIVNHSQVPDRLIARVLRRLRGRGMRRPRKLIVRHAPKEPLRGRALVPDEQIELYIGRPYWFPYLRRKFEGGYHGDTFGAMATSRDPVFFGRFEPLLFRAEIVPVSAERVEEVLSRHRGEVAAVIRCCRGPEATWRTNPRSEDSRSSKTEMAIPRRPRNDILPWRGSRRASASLRRYPGASFA